MPAKFYGVKIGKIPGVYSSWSECEEQIKGFKGAIFKSFKSKKDAENFCGIQSTKAESIEKPVAIKNKLDIYVDGSYRKGKYSWAFVVYEDDKEIYYEHGIDELCTSAFTTEDSNKY
jgi:Predicted double-stranded RNA/RNA-DNA hybrid binding protein